MLSTACIFYMYSRGEQPILANFSILHVLFTFN
jgi:hypothetical protein